MLGVWIVIRRGEKDLLNLENLRPISLLLVCVLVKQVESYLKEQIQELIEQRGILRTKKFGFRSKVNEIQQALCSWLTRESK